MRNSDLIFSAWIFPPLEVVLGAGVLLSSLSTSHICSVLEISTLGGGAGDFVVVVVDVDVVISAGGGGFRPRSSRL